MGTLVQTVANENYASATTIATGSFASNVAAGNFLQIFVSSDAADTVTITQNSGTATIGAVTERGSVVEAGTLDEGTILTCAVTGSGSLDLLCTYGSAQTARCIVAHEISGVSGYQGHDIQTDTGSNPSTTLTVNVTTQPAFVVADACFLQGGTPGVGTGFTDGGTFWGTVRNGRVQYKAVTSTGNTTGNFVNALLDRNNCAMVVWTDGGGSSPALDDSGSFPGFEARSNPLVISIW